MRIKRLQKSEDRVTCEVVSLVTDTIGLLSSPDKLDTSSGLSSPSTEVLQFFGFFFYLILFKAELKCVYVFVSAAKVEEESEKRVRESKGPSSSSSA